MNDRQGEDQQLTFHIHMKRQSPIDSGGLTINTERINSQLSLLHEKVITSVHEKAIVSSHEKAITSVDLGVD